MHEFLFSLQLFYRPLISCLCVIYFKKRVKKKGRNWKCVWWHEFSLNLHSCIQVVNQLCFWMLKKVIHCWEKSTLKNKFFRVHGRKIKFIDIFTNYNYSISFQLSNLYCSFVCLFGLGKIYMGCMSLGIALGFLRNLNHYLHLFWRTPSKIRQLGG